MCEKCYNNSDYINGMLDKNSKIGKAFIAQRVVAKVLNISLKNDCNCSIGFNHPYDLYDKGRYNTIDVKSSKLYKNNVWHFGLYNKYISDTYIFVGYDEDRKNILHVWIIKTTDYLVFKKKGITLTNTFKGLSKFNLYEADSKLYNESYHSMSLNKCSVLRK